MVITVQLSMFIFWTCLHNLSLITVFSMFILFCRFLRQLDYFIIFSKACQQLFEMFLFFSSNGERGIWTLAPRERPTPLAGAPLQPLEYFSISEFFNSYLVLHNALIIIQESFFFVNIFLYIFIKIYNSLAYTIRKVALVCFS